MRHLGENAQCRNQRPAKRVGAVSGKEELLCWWQTWGVEDMHTAYVTRVEKALKKGKTSGFSVCSSWLIVNIDKSL